jgi:hypothetical protein
MSGGGRHLDTNQLQTFPYVQLKLTTLVSNTNRQVYTQKLHLTCEAMLGSS